MVPLVIRPEQTSDRAAIFAVNAAAFPTEAEACLVDQLRHEGFVRCSLVAELEGKIVGHILFSELPIIADEATPRANISALSLAPLAVHPTHQRQGIGSQLIRCGLEKCRQQAHHSVIVLGEPAFYGRFGFTVELTRHLRSPYAGEYFLALELTPDALAGVHGSVQYPPPFATFD